MDHGTLINDLLSVGPDNIYDLAASSTLVASNVSLTGVSCVCIIQNI